MGNDHSEIRVYDDGPRLLRFMWLRPFGEYRQDRSFWWLWRFWSWFDVNADYGRFTVAGSVIEGFRMARLQRKDTEGASNDE